MVNYGVLDSLLLRINEVILPISFQIICHLKRSKVDVNREIIEGALHVPLAEATHKTYHAFIRKAKAISNRGILFDIHGQVSKCNPKVFN